MMNRDDRRHNNRQPHIPIIGQQPTEVPVGISSLAWHLEPNGALKLTKDLEGKRGLPRESYVDGETLVNVLLDGVRAIVQEEMQAMFQKLHITDHFPQETYRADLDVEQIDDAAKLSGL